MQTREQLEVNGLMREFLIYLPERLPDAARTVIISLHGTLGSAEQMMSFADFRPLADEEAFMIVCPEGITQTWNDGRATLAHQQGIDDVGFIGHLITHLVTVYAADARRVFVTGMSNGGFMASRLACAIPERITAIAAVAATLDRLSGMKPQKPLPVLYIHGTQDRLVPYTGGPTKAAGGDVYGHEETLNLWIRTNECNPAPAVVQIPDQAQDGTSATGQTYTSSSTSLQVVGYTIINGGHTWPDGPEYASRYFVGLVSHNLNACQVIWNFFKQYV